MPLFTPPIFPCCCLHFFFSLPLFTPSLFRMQQFTHSLFFDCFVYTSFFWFCCLNLLSLHILFTLMVLFITPFIPCCCLHLLFFLLPLFYTPFSHGVVYTSFFLMLLFISPLFPMVFVTPLFSMLLFTSPFFLHAYVYTSAFSPCSFLHLFFPGYGLHLLFFSRCLHLLFS